MKLSAGIVLASVTASLASMRDHPPRHLAKHLARFADDAVFHHIGGPEDAKAAALDARQAPTADTGAGTGAAAAAGAGAGAAGPPAVTSAAPAFPTSSYYAPLNFSPTMPDQGYNPPTYAPSTATGGAGAPAAGPPGAGATGAPGGGAPTGGAPAGGAPSYGGWGPPSSGGPPASAGPPSYGGPPSSAGPPTAGGAPASSWSAPPAEESCSTGTEVWGGHTYTSTGSTPGQPTGWGGSSPGSAPVAPAPASTWGSNSTTPAATSTWQTSTAPSPTAAPAPDNGGFDQGAGSSGGSDNKPTTNAAAGISKTSIGALVSLCAVALAAAFL